jgi:hypothetical protein
VTFHKCDDVRLVLPQAALTVIFDECDGFDKDETGGRVIGTFKEDGKKLTLQVTGIIESGPKATRSAVSFFQDGEHQEKVFRKIETRCPEIEHLGNWHTHHVNGLSHLSGGDIDTYRRTVNHHKHNTSFFYALLVVAKHNNSDPLRRYSLKHYIFRRGDEHVYEIPQRFIEVVNLPLAWPAEPTPKAHPVHSSTPESFGARPERVYDKDILGEFYKGVRPFSSPKIGLYWRGPIDLLDGSKVQVVIVEDSSSGTPSYSIVLRDPPDALKNVAEHLGKAEFPSARAAIIAAERGCNRALYELRGNSGKIDLIT